MTDDLRWNVRSAEGFPLQPIPGDPIGVVDAATKEDARKKAEDLYGRSVVVERQTRGDRERVSSDSCINRQREKQEPMEARDG